MRDTRNMREIARDVALKHRMTLPELMAPRRFKSLSHARQEAMWTMYATGRYSNLQIAHFFGFTDHTTVVHGRKAHAARAAADVAKWRGIGPALHSSPQVSTAHAQELGANRAKVSA